MKQPCISGSGESLHNHHVSQKAFTAAFHLESKLSRSSSAFKMSPFSRISIASNMTRHGFVFDASFILLEGNDYPSWMYLGVEAMGGSGK